MERLKDILASIRTRLVIFALLIALAPLVFVSFGPLYEWLARSFMEDNVVEAAKRAESVLSRSNGEVDDKTTGKLGEIADDIGVWLRVYDSGGQRLFSARRAIQTQKYKIWLEEAAKDAPRKPHLVAYDENQPPLFERTEFREAKGGGESSRCGLAQDGRLQVCVHARILTGQGGQKLYIYALDGSIRGIRMLWDDPYPLLKLVVQLLIFSLVVALIAGWWSVRPLKNLHEQVTDRARPPVSTDRIGVRASGELGELEEAFNDLLEALEERRKATKAYMADIAHEVKNPVAAIKSAAGRLESGEITKKRLERITRVLEDSTERLDQLVTRFLELARAEAGLVDEDREPISVDALAEELFTQFADDQRYHELEFESQIESAEVEASAPHLETALRNLIENAASFAQSTVELQVKSGDGEVAIAVTDDGPGIDPEDLPYVFDRFFSRRAGNKGTGLGLAMTRAVVEAHDGEIDVDSTPGEGTTFRVKLPEIGSG